MSSEKTNDEIDLKQVFAAIGDFFNGIGNGILRFIATLRRVALNNKMLFISLIVVSQLVGVSYSLLLKKDFYNSSMILKSDYLNKQTVENTIGKLNSLCDEKERSELAKTLKIDLAIAKNIVEFDYRPFVTEGEKIEYEILKEQLSSAIEEKKDLANRVAAKLNQENITSFEIIVKVYDPEIISNLETSLMNYLKENDFIKKRMESTRINLLERKTKLMAESQKLDSLKKVIYLNFVQLTNQSRGSNNVILGDKYMTDPLMVYKEDLLLNKEILDIDQTIYLRPDFEIVDGFTAFREPDSASLPVILIIAFGIAIVSSYLIVGLLKFDKYLDKIPV